MSRIITRVISGDRVLSTQRANLSQKRGFEFSELELNSLGILMVKAPIDRVSPLIAKLLRGTLEILEHQDTSSCSTYQLLDRGTWIMVKLLRI